MKTHKKIIYIWFGWFAIVKTAIFFFGMIAWVFWIGNVFADSTDCSILSSANLGVCCPGNDGKKYRCENKGINRIANNTFSTSKTLELHLAWNNIQDFSFLENLVNLTVLDLSSNKITLLTRGSENHLNSLQSINLGNNYLWANLSSVFNILWPNVHTLYLNNNNIDNISSLSALKNKKVRYLYLNNNNITWINELFGVTLNELDISSNCIESWYQLIDIFNNLIPSFHFNPQRNCSNWTWQDVTITFSELTWSFDEWNCNETLTEAYFWLNMWENSNEPEIWNYWTGITVTCDTWDICTSTLNYYFINSNNEGCGTGEIPIQIDKKPPTCEIGQDGIEKSGDVYRPTNHNIILNVSTTDEWIWKIAYTWYKRNEEERDMYSTTTISENGSYSIRVRDAVWNETGCSITVSNIDREKPAPATGNESMCFSWNTNISFSETEHEIGSGFGWSYIVYSTWGTELSCSSEIWESWSIQTFSETTTLNIWVCDEAWNITTGEYTYARDRAPITTISGYNRQWTWNNVLLTFHRDDGHILCNQNRAESQTFYCIYSLWGPECLDTTTWENTRVDCGDWNVCQTYIKYYSVNGSWITESTRTWLVKIDKEAPSCNITQEPASDIYTSGTVVLMANASDWIWSNNVKYNWIWSFGNNTQSGVANNWKYSVKVKDAVWNERSYEIEVSNIDKTSPTITVNPWNDNSAKKSREIAIIANDNLAWFVWNQNFKYYWSDVNICENNENNYTQIKNFDSYDIGSTTITWTITKSDWDWYKYLCIFWWILDRAGNSSIVSSGWSYLFDNTWPTWDIQISYNWNTLYASGYKLELTLSWFDLYSEVSGMQFSCNNTNWTEMESFDKNKSLNLSDLKSYWCNTWDWVKTIYMKLVDSLLNVWNSISGSIILDTTAPNCTINQAACTSGSLLLTLIWNEILTWVSLSSWTSVNDKTYTIWVTSNDTISIVVNDLAWNTKNCSITPTNYDINGPTITFDDTSIDECATKAWSASATDVWCAWIAWNDAYKFDTTDWGWVRWNATLNLTSNQTLSGWTSKIYTVTVRDSLWNENTKSATLTIINTNPTIGNITRQISWLLTWETRYWNIVDLLNVNDGACGTWTITANLVWECINASASNIQNNILTIKPNQNIEWTGICTIEFSDDEWNPITWFVAYTIDTRRPEPAECDANACFKNNISISCYETKSESGNKIVYSTGNDISCNSPTRSTKTFSSSTTLKVAVCDTVWHISDISTYQYSLDNQSPNTTLSWLPVGWTGNNINLWVSVQDNCEQSDTYYCITGMNNTCRNSDYQKVSWDNIDVNCPIWELCENTIWYYSVDWAWNQEAPRSEMIQIDKKPLTCDITFDQQCTNSGIILTLTASKELSNTLFGWNRVNENEHIYTKTISWNEDISVIVFDHINNSYTCTASVHNFDDSNPIINSLDLYTGYECETINISPDVIDGWCSLSELVYMWDDNTGSRTHTLQWDNNSSLGIHDMQFTVIDSVWNSTTRTIKYQWIDIPISGENISVHNVWNWTWIKWKDFVSAWECEEITASLISSGTIWNCELLWDYIEYLPNIGSVWNDVCQLNISDGDSNIDIYIMRYEIDNLMPSVTLFTGWFWDVCTNQDTANIMLSFNKPVTWVDSNTVSGEHFVINSFDWYSWYQYMWNIALSGEWTWKLWLNTGWIADMVWNNIVWETGYLILWNYDNIGPSIPELHNLWSSELSKITLSREPSTTTGCANLDKYEIMVCDDLSMENNCKLYESNVNEKTMIKWNWNYYWQVLALDTNGNRSNTSNVWNFTISSDNPACIIEVQDNSICTSGNIELKLTANKSVDIINSGWIDWIAWENNTWIGHISRNGEVNGLIIEDGDGRTGTCDELVISNFDETRPTTILSGLSYLSWWIFWINTDTYIDLIATDTWCGNNDITTIYCISENNTCEPNIEWNSILLTGTDNMITKKYIKYHSIDKAWNTEWINSVEINIDNQAPQCTITQNTTDITNSTVIIALSWDDSLWIGLNQVPYLRSGNTVWSNQRNLIVRNVWTYTGYVRDILWNIGECGITIDNIDTIAPEWAECTISSCFSESINVNCNEKVHEDWNYIVYSTDGTSPVCGWNSGNNFEFNIDTVLNVAVCDSANNMSDIATYTYIVDEESPYTTVEWLPWWNGWTWSDILITLSGTDYGCAGWINTYFRVLNSEGDEAEFSGWNEVLVECETGNVCIKYLEFYSADILGNTWDIIRKTIKIDKQWPSCEIVNFSNWWYTSGSLVLRLSGNDWSWVGVWWYSWTNNLWLNNTLTVNTNGIYTGIVLDLLWNMTECSKSVNNIDNIPPKWAICNTDNACYSGGVSISCNEKENETWNYIVYSIDNSNPSCNSTSWNNFHITNSTIVKVAVCDKAKNMSDITTYTYNLDTQAPTTTIHGVADDWVWTDVSIDLSANDPWCANGLKTYYCIDTGNLCNPNISGNHTTISCTNWNICQKYIRYYSIDSVWNKENTKYALVKINRSILSCSISYDRNTCTKSGISVHLNVSEPISGISWWNQIDERNYEKIVNWNWTISATVRSALWGTYTCNTDVTTYDATPPTLDVNDEYIAYKCENINIIASWYDSGCQWNNLRYKWNNQTWNNIRTIPWNNWYRLNQDYNITLSLSDAAGNISEKNIKYKWIGTWLTLNTGIVNWWFIGSWDIYSTTISDIISKFGANEWMCGSWNISITTWTCIGASLVITWGYLNISYTSNFNVSCDIVFDNGEWKVATWKLLFENNSRSDSCLSGWNNDKFLNEGFWDNYASSSTTGEQQIICAVWWASWWDMTVYTKWLDISEDNQCDIRDMKVIETGQLPENLESNSIYVLNSAEITLSGTIVIPKCSAMISKNWTTLYIVSQSNSGMIYLDGDYIIIDNISLNGYVNEHQFNKVWLQLAGDKSHILINNVKVLNNENWFVLDHNNHILFNNIMTYNNYDNWLSIWASAYIALNNVLSFKNGGNGINVWWSEHIILNNIQTFNNSDKWISEIASNDIITNNDIKSYNEWSSASISRSNVVNPINKNWAYLLWWTGITIKWYDTNLWQISWYSFGDSVLMQKPTMLWIWSNTWIVWNYDRNKFIASNTSNPRFNVSIWKYFNSGQELLVSWDNNLIQYYSVYGDLSSNKTWVAIWTKVSLQLSGALSDSIIIQLYGSGFFAVHSVLDKSSINTSGDNYTGDRHNLDLYRYEDGDQSITQANWYTRELNNAYRFAYLYKVTTKDDIYSADLYGSLTRIAMAKMLSNYAINILGKTPNGTNNCKFNDVSTYMDSAYDLGVSNACKLWIMWINMPNNKFRPNDTITRWEFATALSRLLYNTPDGNPYYETHLSKLKSEWILTNTNPNLEEVRWYVMLMLMRSLIKNQK